MSDPITTAAASGLASGKLLNAAAAFLGSLVSLGTTERRMPPSMWMALMLFAVLLGYFIPPVAVAGMRASQWPDWLQSEGLIAMLLGLGCMYINHAFQVLGKRFSKDPVGFVVRRGRDTEEERRHDS